MDSGFILILFSDLYSSVLSEVKIGLYYFLIDYNRIRPYDEMWMLIPMENKQNWAPLPVILIVPFMFCYLIYGLH